MTTLSSPTLAGTLLTRAPAIPRNITLAVAGSLLLWLSAKVQVPFHPVPLTFQTLAVLVIGMAFGARLGAAAVALYLAEGALGLPVFAGTPEKGIGIAYIMGPTGGYLIGSVIAAYLCGWLAERGFDRRPFTTALTMLAGNAALYVPGLLWLGVVVGWDKPLVAWGLEPFLLGDVLKMGLGVMLMPLAWRLSR